MKLIRQMVMSSGEIAAWARRAAFEPPPQTPFKEISMLQSQWDVLRTIGRGSYEVVSTVKAESEQEALEIALREVYPKLQQRLGRRLCKGEILVRPTMEVA